MSKVWKLLRKLEYFKNNILIYRIALIAYQRSEIQISIQDIV